MGMSSGELHQQPLDTEWVKIILSAKDMGFSIEDIRSFFKECVGQGQSGRE
jgi:DNA-binding transcriptional MerR regulator